MDFKTLLSSGEQTSKSLEEVADFNANLKSLLDEQKQLEDKMAELTGKKEASNTNKKYEHEIKSIDQKKKEERTEEKKRQKSNKKQEDRWKVDIPVQKKTKEPSISIPSKILTKKKKENGFIQAKKTIDASITTIKQRKKKAEKSGIKITKQNKTNLTNTIRKVKEGKDQIEIVQKQLKKSLFSVDQKTKQKTKPVSTLIKKAKKVQNLVIETRKESKKTSSLIANPIQKKEKNTNESFPKLKENKPLKTTMTTVKKAVNTYQNIKQVSPKVISGLQQLSTNAKAISVGNNISKSATLVNKLDNSISKVDQLFNTANKYLNKTTKTVGLIDKKVEIFNTIYNKEKKTANAFDLGFIQNQKSKKEENQNFNVSNKKLSVDINTIKKVKKGIDTLKSSKNKKDSFSF
ncbi:hypothetical protein P8625_08955 [Tenacibaculum tangerinum]|uniref:Uncharacterized protein n=1 Tax=Tenacibaculum tangerinum TaxID=3038772 RepID=A0ABY8KYD0_9FLAO|nr:hypothetical protein [Tenacibaculum tangerinum]WGH74247.1 hypothetical protein P8625_08955 [Tenacibaculum tangerinum]